MSEINAIATNNYILHNIDAKKLYVQEPLFTANSGDAVYVGWRPDETVLWSGAGTTACTLSESPSAFDRIRFYGYRNEGSLANSRGVFEFPTEGMTGYNLSQLLYNNEHTYRALYLSRYAISGASCTLEKAQHLYTLTGSKTWDGPGTVPIVLYKIVGINRKENA